MLCDYYLLTKVRKSLQKQSRRTSFNNLKIASRLPCTPLLTKIDEDETCEDEYYGECNNPTECSAPTDAVDVEEEVGEPLIACDEVACVDKGYI